MIGNVSEDTNVCIPRTEDTGLSPKKIKMMVKKKIVWVFCFLLKEHFSVRLFTV